MKRLGVILLLIAALLSVGGFVFQRERGDTFVKDIEYTDGSLVFHGGVIQIALAETRAERLTGLSRQRVLGESEGLLFVFNESAEHGIWMRDMNFPIDIIWLDTNLSVVDIKENATPESYRSFDDAEVFTPRLPARYVLEVRAGFVDAQNIIIGDIFSLTKGE